MRLQLSPLFVGQIMSIEHGEQLTPLTSQFAKGQTLPWIRVNEGDLTTVASSPRWPSRQPAWIGRRPRWHRQEQDALPATVDVADRGAESQFRSLTSLGSICQHGTALGGTARPA